MLKDNKVWEGYGFLKDNAYFHIPRTDVSYANGVYDPEKGTVKFRNCTWFTNLDIKKRHEPLRLYAKYDPEKYPKYDNYDAIEVGKVAEIPEDYMESMGVPITFMDRFCPEQFEIVGFRKGADGQDLVYTRERERVYPYLRILIRRRG